MKKKIAIGIIVVVAALFVMGCSDGDEPMSKVIIENIPSDVTFLLVNAMNPLNPLGAAGGVAMTGEGEYIPAIEEGTAETELYSYTALTTYLFSALTQHILGSEALPVEKKSISGSGVIVVYYSKESTDTLVNIPTESVYWFVTSFADTITVDWDSNLGSYLAN